MKFYQDLPEEYQEMIFEGLKKELKKEMKEHGQNNITEFVDDWINCNNTPNQVKKWFNDYCL